MIAEFLGQKQSLYLVFRYKIQETNENELFASKTILTFAVNFYERLVYWSFSFVRKSRTVEICTLTQEPKILGLHFT